MNISECIGLTIPAVISLTWLGLNITLGRKLSRIEKLISAIGVQKSETATTPPKHTISAISTKPSHPILFIQSIFHHPSPEDAR